MRIFAFVISLGSCLSFLPFVNSVKCIMCDPEYEGFDCKETHIDCSTDHELGGVFDSCFTYQMVVVDTEGFNFTHLDKNCSIRAGCNALSKMMCEKYNESLEGLVQSCNIQCCNSFNYCNVGVPNFSTKTDTSCNDQTTTRTTTGHRVLGYRSTASRDTGDKWKLFFGIICLVIYSMASRVLL